MITNNYYFRFFGNHLTILLHVNPLLGNYSKVGYELFTCICLHFMTNIQKHILKQYNFNTIVTLVELLGSSKCSYIIAIQSVSFYKHKRLYVVIFRQSIGLGYKQTIPMYNRSKLTITQPVPSSSEYFIILLISFNVMYHVKGGIKGLLYSRYMRWNTHYDH